MLRIKHLSKSYGEKIAVDDLTLHVASGEICGFIGPNGAGKTTTLKSVIGIQEFDDGEIFINRLSVKDDPLPCKMQAAYLPDNPDLFDYMTGAAYLNFIADVFGLPNNVRNDRIALYAEKFDMVESLGQQISSYSHGMKQKLAVISAWIHAPRLILMDEPFVGLDPQAAHVLKEMMRQHCERGGAILFSTHVLEVAEKLCDKVAIIQAGKLVKYGTLEAVSGDEALEDVFLSLVERKVA